MFPNHRPEYSTTSLSMRVQSANDAVYGSGVVIVTILESLRAYPGAPVIVPVRNQKHQNQLAKQLPFWLASWGCQDVEVKNFNYHAEVDWYRVPLPRTITLLPLGTITKNETRFDGNGVIVLHLDHASIAREGPYAGLPDLRTPNLIDRINQIRVKCLWHTHLILAHTIYNSALKPKHSAVREYLDCIDGHFAAFKMLVDRRQFAPNDPLFESLPVDAGYPT